jgi:hypothetical protein
MSRRSWLLALAAWAGATALLVLRGRAFDFICDDAFIVFRYARNWVEHGEIAYNLGERVEGYTSPAWMALVALGFRIGLSEHQVVDALGVGSIALLAAGAWAMWRELAPDRPGAGAIVVLATGASAPLAAWAFAGLETPLYAALVVIALVAGARAIARGGALRWIGAGVLVGLATLARPEGGILVVALSLSALGLSRTRLRTLGSVLLLLAGFGLLMIPCLSWRLSYYGDIVPNTYLVKSSGDAGALFKRGLKYLVFAHRDMGVVLVSTGLALVFAPLDLASRPRARVGAAAIVWSVRILVVATLAHVARVGGDFLEMYRFLVPILVPAALCASARALSLLDRVALAGARARTATAVIGLACVGGFVVHDLRWASLAATTTDSTHTAAWLESISWTRKYALRWGAMGRWLRAHAIAGDKMAVGAAGAMPYYAGVPNLDVLGLCSREVALHGDVVENRPGHQRHATFDQIEKFSPTFLFDGDQDSDTPSRPKKKQSWEDRGYVWMEATLDRERYRAPSTFYYYFLVRGDRAPAVEAGGDARRVESISE